MGTYLLSIKFVSDHLMSSIYLLLVRWAGLLRRRKWNQVFELLFFLVCSYTWVFVFVGTGVGRLPHTYMRACINAHFHTYVMSQLLKTARRFRENGSRKRKTYCIECIISRTLSRTAQVWEVGASLSAKGFGVDFVVLTAFLLSPVCLCFPSIASASRSRYRHVSEMRTTK